MQDSSSRSRRRVAFATAISSLFVLGFALTPARAECTPKASRCGNDWAFCPDIPALTPLIGDGCSNIEPGCPRPAHCPRPEKSSCGEYWTAWSDLGDPVSNPCPEGCIPTDRLGRDSRTVNYFFAEQYRERWACAGAPPSRAKAAFK